MTLAKRKTAPSHGQEPIAKSNVKVIVRIRPENHLEKGGNSRVIVQYMNENVLVFDPKEQNSPGYGYRNRRKPRDIRQRQNKDLRFAFDYVFGPNSKNHEVYEQSTKHILNSFLNGYNCSVFAYGATGAGKTHTMLGSPEQPGVIYMTMMELYGRMAAIEADKTCDIAVSYLEVYNENIIDLLMPGKCLPVREDSRNGVVVPGLSLHKPRTADELLHMLHFGNQNRSQHPTDANAESSRSHAVFQVFIKQKDRTANVSTVVKIAKMCLVDLAGSERATVNKNRGVRFREGANINRSLLALGNVINALADSKYKGHVPYRDSKLTRLLKDSLGGNCQTCMIAAVSPSSLTYEDTYNTLKYADRARNIQSCLKKNLLNVDFHVAKYGQIIEELRLEIVELKDKLRFYEEGKMVAHSTTNNVEICRLREKLDGIFGTHLRMCQEHLDIEMKSRDMQWKIYRKEKCLSWIAFVSSMQQNGFGDRIKKTISTSRQRLQSFLKSKDETNQRMEENKKNIKELESTVKDQINGCGDHMTSEILKSSLEYHQTNLQLTEAQYCVRYFKRVVRSQEKEINSNERLIIKLLECLRQQHDILQTNKLVNSDLESNYHCIQSLCGGREVAFADQSYCSTASESNTSVNKIKIGDLLNFKSTGCIEDTNDVLSTQPTQHSTDISTKQSSQIISAEGAQRVLQPDTNIGLPMRVDSHQIVHTMKTDPPNSQEGSITSKHSGFATDHSVLSADSGACVSNAIHNHTETSNGGQSVYPQSSTNSSYSLSTNSGLNGVVTESVESKLFAGHTPAPKKLGTVPSEIDTEVMAKLGTGPSELNTKVMAKLGNVPSELNTEVMATEVRSDRDCQEIKKSTVTLSDAVSTNLGATTSNSVSISKELKSTKSSHDLNSTFSVIDTVVPTTSKNGSKCLNDTFTLANSIQSTKCLESENSVSSAQDLNSTFTLDETCSRNPVVSARTPVIGDKYCIKNSKKQQNSRGTKDQSSCNLDIVHNATYVNNVYKDTSECVNSCVQSVLNENESRNVKVKTPQVSQTMGINSQTVTKSERTASTLKPVNKLLENVKNIPSTQSQTVCKSGTGVLTEVPGKAGDLQSIGKSQSCSYSEDSENVPTKNVDIREKGHCVRSIVFDQLNTPEKGRSYADVAKTPPVSKLQHANGPPSVSTPTRAPLRQVNGNSTPLATPLTPNVEKQQQRVSGTPNARTDSTDLKPNSLFSQKSWDESTKENARTLQGFGLPSLTDRPPKSANRPVQPKYMQMTKSLSQKFTGPSRYPNKNFSRNRFESQSSGGNNYRKPLERSQSTSSFHRRGWQI